jgi:outer membrane protein
MGVLRRSFLALFLATGALVAAAPPALAQQAGGVAVELPEVRNFVGLGAGILPDYTGSNDYTAGAAPVGLMKLGESERYVRLVATELYLNLIDDKSWSFGPVVNYRWGRSDVQDNVVDRMQDIDGTAEAGLFAGWSWIGEDDPRHRLNLGVEVLHDVGSVYDGFVASASARYFHPVSRPITLSLGVATTYGDEDYMETYFGVDAADAGRSGLPRFSAGDGIRDVRISPMMIFSLSPNWHLAGGVIYSRLVGDAADSPVVDNRGSEDQLFAGVGVAYAW